MGYRLLQHSLGLEPRACLLVQARNSVCFGEMKPVSQQLQKEMMVAVPLVIGIKRDKEDVAGAQFLEKLRP